MASICFKSFLVILSGCRFRNAEASVYNGTKKKSVCHGQVWR